MRVIESHFRSKHSFDHCSVKPEGCSLTESEEGVKFHKARNTSEYSKNTIHSERVIFFRYCVLIRGTVRSGVVFEVEDLLLLIDPEIDKQNL